MKLIKPVEIADGVYQLWGVGSKVTVVANGDELVMVDAGGPGSLRLIAAGLRQLGYSLEQVRLVVMTHYHPDHSGGLGRLAEAASASVAAHRIEADMLCRKEPFPSPFQSQALARLSGPLVGRLYGTEVRVDYALEDGDRLPVAEDVRIIHTPGHTPGSICLYLESKKVVIVGDALQNRFGRLSLPAATVTWDMNQAAESLKKLLALDFETICFSHFHPVQHDARDALRRLLERKVSGVGCKVSGIKKKILP